MSVVPYYGSVLSGIAAPPAILTGEIRVNQSGAISGNWGYQLSVTSHGLITIDATHTDLINALTIDRILASTGPEDFVVRLVAAVDPGQAHFTSITIQDNFAGMEQFDTVSATTYVFGGGFAEWTWDRPGGPLYSIPSNNRLKPFSYVA